jgi:hypothetical protein
MKHPLTLLAIVSLCAQALAAAPIDIGSRRELFVDQFLIDRRDGVELRLQRPTPREIVLVHDAPWEGTGCVYHSIFRDGPLFRMYYLAGDLTNEDGTKWLCAQRHVCYAESTDGIHWKKPDLGLIAFRNSTSKHNNIVWTKPGADNFAVFKDSNPACR